PDHLSSGPLPRSISPRIFTPSSSSKTSPNALSGESSDKRAADRIDRAGGRDPSHEYEDTDRKEDMSPDWYVEGPGRRVGYDDLTAIDWIYEYTKERQRLRKLLAVHKGFVGNLRQLLDASHVWV